MKRLILALLAATMAPLALPAQQADRSRYCPARGMDKDVLITICTHAGGMASRIQPRLHFRIHSNGLAEYEIDRSDMTGLATKTTQLAETEVRDIANILAMPEILDVKDEYPRYRRWIDSSLVTRVTLRSGKGEKTTVLNNFTLDDYDVASRYPPVLVLLLRTIDRYRDRAMGVVKPIPNISFGTMIDYPDPSGRKEIYLYADYEHHATMLATGKIMNEHEMLYDHESANSTRIEMKFEAQPEAVEAMKNKLAEAESRRYGGRARILVRGRYEQTVDTFSRRRIHIFYAMEILGCEPIDLPFKGEIKLGWNYIDTFDRSSGEGELQLSTRLKLPLHHAGRIEWTNADMFPRLFNRGRHSVVFRATSQTTQQITPGRWNETFHATILEGH